MCKFEIKYEDEDGEIVEMTCTSLEAHWLVNGSSGYSGGSSVIVEGESNKPVFLDDDDVISIKNLERCGGRSNGFKVYKYSDGSDMKIVDEIVRRDGDYIVGDEKMSNFHSIR